MYKLNFKGQLTHWSHKLWKCIAVSHFFKNFNSYLNDERLFGL
jgi:hypothetical protein